MFGGTMTVGELLAGCEPDALAELDDGSLARLGAALLGWWPRLEAARLRVIAAVDARQAFRVDGCRDAAAWLAWKAGERRGAAGREVDLAAAVAAMPAVDTALADGSVSKAKAVELGRAVRADAVDQRALVEAAQTLSVEAVARRVDRWYLEHQPAAVDIDEAVHLAPVPGGGRLDVTLDAEGFEWVQVALDTAADQLTARDQPWTRRRARGLVAVCRYFVDHAHLPTRRAGRPTVVVTVDVDTLAAQAGGSARLDSGGYVTGETARRLACDAGLVRLIVDPASMPLEVGRATRSVSPAQARAVIHRDGHCRFEGCSAPPWACDVHHLDFWARGGRTDLHRLGLLCWHHHQLTHRCATSHDLTDRGDRRLRLEPRSRRRTSPPHAA
jgi:hypothetical protein